MDFCYVSFFSLTIAPNHIIPTGMEMVKGISAMLDYVLTTPLY
jgi:hypothetical protein